jgi:ABC-2 type transport system permease protein
VLFTFLTAWVFGREFADHTAKQLLALPTPRAAIVSAKCVVVALWAAGLTILMFGLELVVGAAVGLPG